MQKRAPKAKPHRNPFNAFLGAFIGREDGAVAVVVALMIPVLAGAVALSVDLGRLYDLDTELQHAADASALAAATQLDGNAGARARATTAALTGAGSSCAGTASLACNSQTFASDGAGTNVSVAAGDLRFLVDLTTRAEATSDADAAFVEVTVAPRTVNYGFAGVVGATTSGSPTARAVAGMGSAYCRIPPLMICNPFEDPGGGGAFDPDAVIGYGVTLKAGGSNSPWAPGNFGLLALDNQNISTNAVRDAMGRVNPLAECFGDTVGSKPGQATAVAQGLNVRFDIYEGPIQSLANDPQYRPAMNPVKGLIMNGTSCSYNASGGNGWNKPANTYDGPLDPDGADAMGFPRDNCAYPAPGGPGSCIPTSGGRLGDGVWDIARYMEVNHGSPAIPADLTTAATNLAATPPDTAITRNEVYQWELGGMGSTGTQVDNTAAGGEYGYPLNQCGGPSSTADPDRRIISVAVINCIAEGVVGQTPDLNVVDYIDLFLTEPMGVFDGNNDLYAEVIGRTGSVGALDAVARNVVVLYE